MTREYSFQKISIFLVGILIWFLIARAAIGIRFLALFFIPWVLLGVAIVITLVLNQFFDHFKTIEKFGAIALGTLLIGPALSIGSLHLYWENHEAQMLLALDQFIDEVAVTGKLSSDFVIKHQNPHRHLEELKKDFSEQYQVTYIDFLLGEYDLAVEFDNGIIYDVRIFNGGDYWGVFTWKRDEE
ncbi:MAG: hypothetical protein AAGD96_22430 [Chloroflexota bacterium]